ncbi:hypothetical protein BLA29_014864 [Euroglyphus maynei]|uniref:Uncharacterized protein n=1 Tax=Euroglyphus maynei TaxID=6958 RepID=A0A1Y3B2N2_EURMA|nr:hypothetical protein BLA29_014864 [Euroglyphus maynei]
MKVLLGHHFGQDHGMFILGMMPEENFKNIHMLLV